MSNFSSQPAPESKKYALEPETKLKSLEILQAMRTRPLGTRGRKVDSLEKVIGLAVHIYAIIADERELGHTPYIHTEDRKGRRRNRVHVDSCFEKRTVNTSQAHRTNLSLDEMTTLRLQTLTSRYDFSEEAVIAQAVDATHLVREHILRRNRIVFANEYNPFGVSSWLK